MKMTKVIKLILKCKDLWMEKWGRIDFSRIIKFDLIEFDGLYINKS